MSLATVRVVKNHKIVGARMNRVLDQFIAGDLKAMDDAAAKATTVSRSTWNSRTNRRNPGGLGAFLGRETTGGKLASTVKWGRTVKGEVALNYQQLNRTAPHWIIQEIGTGKRANVIAPGRAAPAGRPTPGGQFVRTVKAQRGRRIPGSLVFATKGGVYSPPPGSGREQLYLRSMVKGAPVHASTMTIRREIKGQHFVQKGGQAGFRQYKKDTLAAARRAFRNRT